MSNANAGGAAGHTPGPWHADDDHNDYAYAVRLGSGLPVASARYSEALPKSEALANAKLIAAAPALLAFVQKCASDGYAESTMGDVADDAVMVLKRMNGG